MCVVFHLSIKDYAVSFGDAVRNDVQYWWWTASYTLIENMHGSTARGSERERETVSLFRDSLAAAYVLPDDSLPVEFRRCRSVRRRCRQPRRVAGPTPASWCILIRDTGRSPLRRHRQTLQTTPAADYRPRRRLLRLACSPSARDTRFEVNGRRLCEEICGGGACYRPTTL